MIKSSISPQTLKMGSCPHGLPQGACPICSGMGGGGAKSKDLKQKSNEMSWDECYAIGQMLKANKQNATDKANDNKTAQQYTFIQNKITTAFIQQLLILQNLLKVLTLPITNKMDKNPINKFYSQVRQTITDIVNNFKTLVINISDKLAAIFGEKETAIREKLSDITNKIKKKLFNFFELIDTSMDENEEDEEFTRISHFERLKKKIFKIYRKEEDDANSF